MLSFKRWLSEAKVGRTEFESMLDKALDEVAEDYEMLWDDHGHILFFDKTETGDEDPGIEIIVHLDPHFNNVRMRAYYTYPIDKEDETQVVDINPKDPDDAIDKVIDHVKEMYQRYKRASSKQDRQRIKRSRELK